MLQTMKPVKAPGLSIPALRTILRLPYTHMGIQEGIRLFPPAWIILCHAIKDVETHTAITLRPRHGVHVTLQATN